MSRPRPRFHYRQQQQRHVKRLRKLLSLAPKIDALEAFWVIDRGRMDPEFRCPVGYDFPENYLHANIDEAGAVHGWEVETLVTELLACPRTDGRRVLNTKSWRAVADVVNALRDAENAEAGLVDPKLILRSLFRLFHRQLAWQAHTWNAADAVRAWSIFGSDLLREVFEARLGLSLRSFIRLGMGWSVLFNRQPFLPRPAVAPSIGVTPDDVVAFISATSITLPAACAAAREIVTASPELAYRRSALRERPIISIGPAGASRFIRPIEQLLFWRITSGIYHDVVGDPSAPNEIGARFEDYTRRLMAAAVPEVTVQGETEFGTRQNPRRSTDCILHVQGAVEMLIECKTKKLPLIAQTTLGEAAARTTAVSEIAKGIVQLCRFERAIVEGAVPGYRCETLPILLLVALDDWVFTGSDIMKDLYTMASEIAEAQRFRSDRITRREVVLCTATELDQIVSTYSYADVKRICAKSIEGKFKDYALISVARECFNEERRPADYPLKPDLDELIGI